MKVTSPPTSRSHPAVILSLCAIMSIYCLSEGGSNLVMAQSARVIPCLQGKRICLDPGHGGTQSGAVGVGGLRESDVNLQVALYLKKLLVQAGAQVFLTREGDQTVSIAQRREYNRRQHTDLFLSIHHNANAQIDRTVNRSEVFYHWYDRGGPSQDAAERIGQALRAALHLHPCKVYMCWAYGVLRENSYPAVLAEASYLSNPQEEQRLRDPAYLQVEAQAYFQGIASFFQGGRPTVTWGSCYTTPEHIVAAIKLQRQGGALIDPQKIRIEHNGHGCSYFYDPASEQAFWTLAHPNCHKLVLAASNLAGHVSVVQRYPTWPGPKSALAHVARGGTVLSVHSPKGPLPQAYVFSTQLKYAYYPADQQGRVQLDKSAPPAATVLVGAPGYWPCQQKLTPDCKVTLLPLFRGVLHHKIIVLDPAGGGEQPGPIASQGLRACDANLATVSYLAAYLRLAGAEVTLTRTRDMSVDPVTRVRIGLELHPAAFLTVDHRCAQPGLGEKAGQDISRVGHRWSSGRRLAACLVVQLRQLLGTGTPPAKRYQPQPLPGEIHNWSSWEVMHGTQRYNAVSVCPRMFDAPGVPEYLDSTAGPRQEALAILYGLVEYFGLQQKQMASVRGVVHLPKSKTPLSDALVYCDHVLVAQTDRQGSFWFKYLEPGQHNLTLYTCQGLVVSRTINLHPHEQLTLPANFFN